MKKIIFLLLIVASSVFGGTCYNSSKDKLTLSNTATAQCKLSSIPVNVIVHDNCDGNYAYMYSSPLYTNSCTDSIYTQNTKYTYQVFLVDRNYQCPAGQEIINGACAVPPTCPNGQIWNSDTDTCVAPPAPDADGDTIPDKCDFDHPNYAVADCDGDGINNTTDPDVDGDGILNGNDTDDDGDGVSDASLYGKCLGANKGYATSTPFPISEYSFHSNLQAGECRSLVFKDTKIDSAVWLPDLQDGCFTPYCYVHYKKNDCDYDSSWYRPGINWDYRPGLTESACGLLVDGIRYSEIRYVTPDDLKCPNTGLCYAKRIDAVPDNNTTNPNTPPNPDTNSTTADLAPLLESQNIGNDLLKGLGEKADTTNKNLDDLKKLANDSLNTQQDSKSLLGNLKGLAESLLDGNNKTNQNLGELGKSLGKFSDTSTQNQVIGNGHLSDISSKMNTNNNLLTSIDNSLKGDGTSPDTSVFDGFSSALSDSEAFISSVNGQFSTFKDNIQGNLDEVMTKYNQTKSLFESGQAPTMSGGGSLECASFNVFGKHVVLDLSFLSVLSPVFYYIFTAYFMFLNFSFLIRHLFVSGD